MNLPPVKYIEVTDNIVMMEPLNEGFPSEGNMICLNMSDDLIFIDATGIQALSTKFRADMETKFAKKASYLFLTHFHPDHIFGIKTFDDVPIIGSQIGLDKFREDLKGDYSQNHRSAEIKKYRAEAKEQGQSLSDAWQGWAENYKNTELILPKIGVKEKLTINNGAQRLTFQVIGGHSECSAYLYYEPDQILFTGDNLNSDHAKRSPCFIAGLLQGFEKELSFQILKQFEEMAVKKVVPGHGSVLNPDYIKETREYFTELFAKLQAMRVEGISAEDALKHPELPPFYEKEKPTYWERILTMWYDGTFPSPD
ncbi:MAG: MBL fold metallo-hydrolase [Candidatus Hermodarchaeota archaeon]